MIKKELEELRRRMRPEKTRINYLVGCYVNEKQEIESTFQQSTETEMEKTEAERVFAYLRKLFSGYPEREQHTIDFRTEQVANQEPCYTLLRDLVDKEVRDEELANMLYEKIVANFSYQLKNCKELGSYMILLACDSYQIPLRGKKVADSDEDTDSSDLDMKYMLCAVCPASKPKTSLNYYTDTKRIMGPNFGWVLDAPMIGFFYPSLEHRTRNIYGAQFYMKDSTKEYDALLKELFDVEKPPITIHKKRKLFDEALQSSLMKDCTLDTYYNLRDKIQLMEMEQTQAGVKEPLINRDSLVSAMTGIGVQDDEIHSFKLQYDALLGSEEDFQSRTIMELDKIELETDGVSIRCKPDEKRRIKTQILDGKKCVVIEVTGTVMVNGLPLEIT